MPKKVVEKFSFSELKIENVTLFIQSSSKIFCISVFNGGGCLAICLTFRPFLTLDPLQLGCLSKKACINLLSLFVMVISVISNLIGSILLQINSGYFSKMVLVWFWYEPLSLDVNKVCLEESNISLIRVKNQEKVKALLNSVDVGNES